MAYSSFHTLLELTEWLDCSPAAVIEILSQQCREDGDCILWTGPIAGNGYGQLKRNRDRCTTHRMSFIAHNGPIPRGLVVMHICDNPGCIHPDHLVVGTNNANMADMKIKGRAPHGSKHPRSKLTPEQVNEIRVLAKYGYWHDQLAVLFRVSRPTITKVVNGTAYSREVL